MHFSRENIILSADDFGVNPQANRAILELARERKIDRVAIMANCDIPQQAIQDISAAGVKLDLHLDFPKPRAEKNHNQSEGVLKRLLFFVTGYFSGRHHHLKMELAWEDQLQKFRNMLGRYPDGLNSHQHIHFFPKYFQVILGLAKKYNIPYVRFGRRGLLENAGKVPQILGGLRPKNKEAFAASALDSSDYLVSLDWITDLEKFLRHLPSDKVEIVVHPERPQDLEIIQKYF